MSVVAGVALFEGVAPLALAFVYGAVFFGFLVRGAFGFGSNMPIVLLTTWVLGPHHTIVVVAVAAAIAQVHLLPQGPRHADWKVVAALVPGTVAGVALGAWGLTRLEASGLMAAMGLLVLAIVVMDWLRVVERLAAVVDLRAWPISSGLAVVSGTLGTLSGGGGIYFLAGYLRHACPVPAAFRSTNIVVGGTFMLARLITLSMAGLIALEYMLEALLLLPAIFAGTWCGGHFFKVADPRRYYGALQALLLAAAAALTAGGVYDMLW